MPLPGLGHPCSPTPPGMRTRLSRGPREEAGLRCQPLPPSLSLPARLCPPCPAMAAAPIRLELRALQGAPREPLHLLPCALRHDGPAPVGRYFTPAVRQGARRACQAKQGRPRRAADGGRGQALGALRCPGS